VNLKIDHSWNGDLLTLLQVPDGSTLILFDRPRVPNSQYGCQGGLLHITLDDEATLRFRIKEISFITFM